MKARFNYERAQMRKNEKLNETWYGFLKKCDFSWLTKKAIRERIKMTPY